MERGLFDTSIEILQTISRDKAVSMANRARQRGFKVECVSDGWNVYHVRISHIDRSEAFGTYRRLQKAGFHPVMI